MDHMTILGKVTGALDALVLAGERYHGLLPSVLDLQSHEMPAELPPPIKGQRDGDRSYPGSNLMHDEPALLTMYGLARALDRPDYAAAADRYLERFATHCTATPNGLFPWGEHAYWDLVRDNLNPDAIHDHLRQAPLWLWEKLWAANRDCVARFAEGLDCHWVLGEPVEYSRHSQMQSFARSERHSLRSCDFARHSGFYIFDLSFAYARTRRPDFRDQISRMIDYWWPRRDRNGLLLGESRSPEGLREFRDVNAPGQTLSLGVSLLESAELLTDVDAGLSSEMRGRGATYTNGFLAAPHDLRRDVYLLGYNHVTGEVIHQAPVWGSIYGVWPACYIALTCLCGYRLAGDQRLYDWAAAVGQRYLEQPIPEGVAIPAMDAGLALGLLADLYDISGDREWLEGGFSLADTLLRVFLDGDLPRGAAGIGWYESQMGPGFLLHGLARISLLAQDKERCPLQADYTAR